MRDPKRIPEILKMIQMLWEKNPELRLCQLLYAVIRTPNNQGDLFYYEDDLLLEDLEAFINL